MIDGINLDLRRNDLRTRRLMQEKHNIIFPGVNSVIIIQVKIGLKRKYFSISRIFKLAGVQVRFNFQIFTEAFLDQT